MNSLEARIRELITEKKIRISEHGYDELTEDGLSVREVVDGVAQGIVVEEYPEFPKGPCALFLQKDLSGSPVHVVWGIPKGYDEPVVLVTAYRPDPGRWDRTFKTRLRS